MNIPKIFISRNAIDDKLASYGAIWGIKEDGKTEKFER